MASSLVNETFSSPPSFPAGWTRTGPSSIVWTISSSVVAGGTLGELKLNYSPHAVGNYRFISPAFDTRKVHDMTMSFRYMLDDYPNTANSYTIGVQISKDLVNWTTVWSTNPTADIAANQVSFDIGYANGMSQNTYIAFWFNGDNNDIDGWYVDNVSLSYTNSLGFGTWPAGDYYPEGELYVPAGQTLSLAGGANLYFQENANLIVQGSLKTLSEFGNAVVFTSLSGGSNWSGIKIFNNSSTQDSTIIKYALVEHCDNGALAVSYSNKIRISNCAFLDNASYYYLPVVYLDHTDAILEDCLFSGNSSSTGGMFLASYGTPIIRDNDFDGNYIPVNGALVGLENCSLSNFTGNRIIRSMETYGGGSALWISGCSGTLNRQMIANNTSNGINIVSAATPVYITNCLIVNNYGKGLVNAGNAHLRSTILWGNSQGSVQNTSTTLTIRYSCVSGGFSGISGTAIPSGNYTFNTSSNPLFVSPSATSDHLSDPRAANWTLQNGSPCIDTGDPSQPADADGSIVDIGMYSRRLKPFISRAADVPADQGRQLDLKWLPNELDTQYQSDWYYTVWREGGTRDDAIRIGSMAELGSALASKAENICWRDGTRTWYYLAQVPVMGFADYGLIVPTLQDSSSTGTHAANYMVVYHNPSNIWMSVPKSGYSADNIPPMPVRALDLQHLGSTLYMLAWDEVTEGIWEGNSYPEVNQVRYRVYASTDPAVPLTPENLVGTTSMPQLLINSTPAARFFRVVAFDTE